MTDGQTDTTQWHRPRYAKRRAAITRQFIDFIGYLPPTKEEVNVFARVCMSVCLLARLLKNACVDLDEMLRVECRQMSGHGRTDGRTD